MNHICVLERPILDENLSDGNSSATERKDSSQTLFMDAVILRSPWPGITVYLICDPAYSNCCRTAGSGEEK